MILSFTENGLLTPNYAIEVTITTLYETFVRAFPTSQTRANLFHEWTRYNHLLRREIGQDFIQWINGSFVTQKPNPEDIDLVSFVPYMLYERYQGVLDNLWADKWEKEGIDAYFVKVYPDNHPMYQQETGLNQQQWIRRYSSTKPDEIFRIYPKGFLTVLIQ